LGDRVVVRPSSLNRFVYCPVYVFLDHYLRAKPPLLHRLRLFLGRIYHWLAERRLRRSGYTCERELEAKMDGVILVGRADGLRINGDTAHIIEVKSGRAPRHPYSRLSPYPMRVYTNDLVQAIAYAYLVKTNYPVKTVVITIKYRDHEETFTYDPLFEAYLGIVLELYRKMVVDKVIIEPFYHSPKKCRSCQYKQTCIQLGLINKKLEWIDPAKAALTR